MAARAAGATGPYIIFRHILPNVISHIIVILTISVPELILAEGALSFLGLGIQPPLVSWGVLVTRRNDVRDPRPEPLDHASGCRHLVNRLSF